MAERVKTMVGAAAAWWREPLAYAALAALLIAGALVLEHGFSYLPCELCHWQRYPYYVLLVVGLPYAGLRLAGRTTAIAERAMLALAGLAFLASGAIGAYHAGVEWHWWAGPGRCTGLGTLPDDPEALMAMLGKVKVIPCDEPALTILGLSLAAWNAMIGIAVGIGAVAAALPERKGGARDG